jgi:predicted RNA binding protein YcfA (HicA-like mRNA interferase family)
MGNVEYLMNGKQVITRLKQEGWTLIKINGSHHMMQNIELNKKVPIPVHSSRDIKIGTIKSIEKQTGVKLL